VISFLKSGIYIDSLRFYLLDISVVIFITLKQFWFVADIMANISNVNSSVSLKTPNVNPTVESNASAVNPLLIGKVPIVVPSVATTTSAINSFMRNMPDPVMG